MPLAVDQLTERIVATKRKLRSQLPNRAEVFAEVEAHVRREVERIRERGARGEAVIPEIDYATIAEGRVGAAEVEEIKRRGAVVVRGTFPRQQAEAWNDEHGAEETPGRGVCLSRQTCT